MSSRASSFIAVYSAVRSAPWITKLQGFLEITKPKVVLLLVFTAWVGMVLVPQGYFDWQKMIFALIGIGLASSSGAALNHLIDERIDAKMSRTGTRPLPSGRLSSREVLVSALLWGVLGIGLLVWQVNVLTAVLTAFALIGYALIYTVYLKHNTPLNIVWGGAAGAAPPLLGWVAMTGSVSFEAVSLFLIIFIWTPPHFWPLAIHRVDDYRRAGVPMLPVVRGIGHTKFQIVVYSWFLLAVTMLPFTLGMMGGFYLAAATALGAVFVIMAWRFYRADDNKLAMPLFGYSITYLMLLFAAMLIDRLLLPLMA